MIRLFFTDKLYFSFPGKIKKLILFSILLNNSSFAQDTTCLQASACTSMLIAKSGYRIYPFNKKRVCLASAANIIGYGTALAGLSHAWYSQYPKSRFHFYNDDKDWLQMDKAGHVYGTYIEGRAVNELWRWCGLPRKQRIWISGLSALAFQTIIETLDGFSSEYGWSWGDFTADAAGFSIFTTQELAWDEQRIKMKFSFHKKNYAEADLNARANVIFGTSEADRIFTDYNGMTEWISINIPPFCRHTVLPPWLSVAIGYGAEGMFGASGNVDVNKVGIVIFNRPDIKRYRQWYLSPDIDLTKIRTHRKVLRFLFGALSLFKFPAPTLEFSKSHFKGHWLYF